MAVISVVGTSGVGKSFLVKQLSSATCSPAFFEGEEGTIPKEVLKSIFSGESPVKRWKFFLDRYEKNLETAFKISKLGHDAYVDGAIISAEAILEYEKEEYKPKLLKMIDSLKRLESDIIVLLTADRKKIEEFISKRSRKSESSEEAIKRATSIQDSFIRLAKKRKNVLLVDRTSMDFTKNKDIQKLLERINKFNT